MVPAKGFFTGDMTLYMNRYWGGGKLRRAQSASRYCVVQYGPDGPMGQWGPMGPEGPMGLWGPMCFEGPSGPSGRGGPRAHGTPWAHGAPWAYRAFDRARQTNFVRLRSSTQAFSDIAICVHRCYSMLIRSPFKTYRKPV